MNNLNIIGKIQRINYAESGKMCFITVRERRTAEETNFIDCVCFSPEFIKKHFSPEKWIGIEGHLHTTKYNEEYKTDVIIDNIHFIGDKTATENGAIDTLPSFPDDEIDDTRLPY